MIWIFIVKPEITTIALSSWHVSNLADRDSHSSKRVPRSCLQEFTIGYKSAAYRTRGGSICLMKEWKSWPAC